jgi:hypothetical protein
MELNRHALMREIKRVELEIAALASRGRGDAPDGSKRPEG